MRCYANKVLLEIVLFAYAPMPSGRLCHSEKSGSLVGRLDMTLLLA
jgi:hypothetical protein